MPVVELGMAAKAAGGASAVGTAGALFLGNYNRANFLYDQGLRFQRFNQARGFANQQMGQYREDIRGMSEMTSAKMDAVYTVCTLMMCIAAAASCAGRVGMHGAAPPGYLAALFTGHIFTAILYLTLAMWLALHASQRAQCAMTSLLTRKVRLPIPSIAEIDQARTFASGFEKQQWGDIFRVPFCRHPQAAPEAPVESSESDDNAGKSLKEGKKKKKTKKRSSSAGPDFRTQFGTTARDTVPSWIRDEQVQDKGGGEAGGRYTKNEHDTPDHFKAFANTQLEFYPYDVYARVGMLYGVLQFIDAMMYYCIATTMCELRAVWIVWSIPVVFIAAQVLILRLDILRKEGQQMLPHLEWAGHLAPYLIVAALTLDYRYTYDTTSVNIAWVFAFAGLICHFLFAIRLLDLAWPRIHRETDMPDEPGKAWWPASWTLPPALARALWVIAPPSKLEPGQHCLMNEMEAMRRTGGGVGACRRRRGKDSEKVPVNPVPMDQLKQQMRRLDSHLEWWYGDSVYTQVSEKGQRRLDELKFELERIKRDFKSLYQASKGATSKQDELDKRNIALAGCVNEVEDQLQEVEATETVAREGGGVSGGDTAYTHRSPFRDNSDRTASTLPWRLTRAAILTVAATWLFVILGTVVDLVMTPDSLLKPPGEPPWIRDQKYRHWNSSWIHLSTQPLPGNYRLFSAAEANYEFESAHHHLSHHMPVNSHVEGMSAGGSQHSSSAHHRRLESDDRIDLAFRDLAKTLPTLGWLAKEINAQGANAYSDSAEGVIMAAGDYVAPRSGSFLTPALSVVKAEWPSLFEPRHIACSPGHTEGMLALTPRGVGVKFHLTHDKEGPRIQRAMQQFALQGLTQVGPLIGASWLEDGLWVVAREGGIMHCPGHGLEGVYSWQCMPASKVVALPVPSGARLRAAALGGRRTAAVPMAAVLLDSAPGVVALYESRGESAGWSPIGEIHVPSQSQAELGSHAGLAFDGTDLLITMASGTVHRRNVLATSEVASAVHHAPSDSATREWTSACAFPAAQGGILRLALKQPAQSSSTWLPELIATP
eukprot:TRINITY_DN1678_c1_g1_i2.p1 TRINITY_DN1678_c1_g1~~TRINITY_DN1678_c1_g1_i2.p1  ORF type:complete len:1051 (+),score=179.82 TRINITY_DN1678_c1_g1_i2:151-3303(+)